MSGYLARAVMAGSIHDLRISKPSAEDLPNLKRVHVEGVYWNWKNGKDPAALRKWFGDESLEIIFEEYAG